MVVIELIIHDIYPLQKLLWSGILTPYILSYLICTIISELRYFLIFNHLSEPGLISAGLKWTALTPAGFQGDFRAGDCMCVATFALSQTLT